MLDLLMDHNGAFTEASWSKTSSISETSWPNTFNTSLFDTTTTNLSFLETTWANFSFSETTLDNFTLSETTPAWPNVTWGNVPNDTTGSKSRTDPEESIATVNLQVLLAYFGIALVGVAGNLLVIMVILCLPRLRTAHNVHVINLCAADALLGLNAFVLVIDVFEQNWAPENGVCGLLSFLTALPPVAVVGSMLCIARNRHAAIVRGVRVPGAQGRRSALVASGAVWACAIVLCLPTVAGWVTSRAGLFCACCIYFVENVVYSMVLTFLVYCLPNVIIAIYYCQIFAHVRRSRRKVLEHTGSGTGPSRGARRLASDVQLAVQFTVLLLVFNVCYLPSTLMFWHATESSHVANSMRGAVTIIFAINIVANPICYFCLNARARREVARALPCLWRRGDPATHRGNINELSGRTNDGPRHPDSPSNRSLRTVTEFTPPQAHVPTHVMATAHVTATSHVTATFHVTPTASTSIGGAPYHETEEAEASDVSGSRQGAARAWRRLPLLRRAESLDVNIISADLTSANFNI